MKKVVFILLLLLPFVSCNKVEDGQVKAELSISKTEVVLDSDAGLDSIVVESSTYWSINDIPQWC